ncbi:hypothetical protein P280DRAFT_505236 [Massarina eburnea CBS 473.64]|uniref:MARVEL domain-containing protein n=1 Tax=Massarina eburnea CBS 473.64 TaxID=1395130 RepID=A0A6A6S9Z6_9PLEO|nr:hypothetical protein P280DRAFT_505236 [Massarina eburnea CBS 473.64]
MSTLVNFAVRAAQIAFAAVVTGLSISISQGHHWGGLPFILGYVSFVGCVTLLGAFAGLAATWVELLQGTIGMLVDAIILVFNLAGGVVLAIKINGVKCADDGNTDNAIKLVTNGLFNGGWKGKESYYATQPDGDKTLLSLCKKNQADAAFLFLTVVVLLVSLAMGFLRMKKGY